MTVIFEFTIRISIMLLSTLHSLFSCGSRRVVSFGRSPSCTPEWFDRCSFLIWSFESLLEDVFRGSLDPQCSFKDILRCHFLLGLEPRCSSVRLSEFAFHYYPYGGLLGSSVEFTSFHSLFTLAFHSSVHVPS